MGWSMTRAEKYAADRQKLTSAVEAAHDKLNESEPAPYTLRSSTLLAVGEHGELIVHGDGRRHLTTDEIAGMMEWLGKWFGEEA